MESSIVTLPKSQTAINYYVKIDQLSTVVEGPKPEEITNTQTSIPAPGPLTQYLPYAPFGISALLFAAAIILQAGQKFRIARIGLPGFFMALFAAAIPAAIGLMNHAGFTSPQAAPNEEPKNVRVLHHDESSATVVWDTTEPQPGIVQYSYTLKGGVHTYTAGSIERTSISHSVRIEHLVPGITYEVRILSGEHWYTDKTPLRFTFQGQPL